MTVDFFSFTRSDLQKSHSMLLSGPEIAGLTALYAAEKPSASVAMTRRMLSRTFRSLKNPNPRSKALSTSPPSPKSPVKLSTTPSASASRAVSNPRSRTWNVYLILSTNHPIKTYVGVTTDFTRRLKQHNGELKGGAKSSSSGRPWVCACIIRGFKDHSEACSFESKWKSLSKKLPRKTVGHDLPKQEDACSLALLQHREVALNRVKGEFDCSHLEIDWQLSLS